MPVLEELKLQLDVAEPPEVSTALVGLQVTLRPVDGLTELVSVRVPLNPLRLARVIVDAPDEPVGNVTVEGLADTAKSFMVTVTATE